MRELLRGGQTIMSWSPELFIGEMRPWPDSVHVVRGKTGETVRYFPERTCRAELNGERSAVICSECGSQMPLKGWGEFRDWGGVTRIGTFTAYPHCPNCGCKVVE